MARFEWRQEYVSGDETVDSQHRQLLVLADLLFEAVSEGREEDILKKSFEMLLVYTKQHFEDEEHLIADLNCSLLPEHRKEQHTLSEELRDLWEEDAMGFADTMGQTSEKWVESRLVPHMIESDQAALRSASH